MEALSRIDILDRSKNAGYRIVGDWQKESIEFLGKGQGESLEVKLKYPLLIWSKLLNTKKLTVFVSFALVSKDMNEILSAFLISLTNRDISVKIEWKYSSQHKEVLQHAKEICKGFNEFEIQLEQVDNMPHSLYSRFFEVWMKTPFYTSYLVNYFDKEAKPDFYLKMPEKNLGLIVGNSQKANITFSGRLFGIKGIKLWEPLSKWTENLPSRCINKELRIDFKLIHIGDKHVEIIERFLQKVENLITEHSFNVSINWFCDVNDEEMLEIGEDFLHEIQGATCRQVHIPGLEEEMQAMSKIDISGKSPQADYRIAGDAEKALIEFSGIGKGQWLEENIGLNVKSWFDNSTYTYHQKKLDLHLKFVHISEEMQKVLVDFFEYMEERTKEKEFLVNLHVYNNKQNALVAFIAENKMQFQKVHILQEKQEENALPSLFPQKLKTPFYEHFPTYANKAEISPDFHVKGKRYIISADSKMGYIALTGAFMGDTFPNFIELQNWSAANVKFFANKHINVYLKFTYLDDSSRLSLKGMFRTYELLIRDEGFTATYFWYNPGDDEGLMEEAETFSYQCLTTLWNCNEDDDEEIIENVQKSLRKGNGGNADFKYIEIPE